MSDPFDLVEEIVDPDHPRSVVRQLASQVDKLLREGISKGVIREALKLWEGKPGSPPSWLPHMVSDAIRIRRAQAQEDERKSSLSNWEEQLNREMNG